MMRLFLRAVARARGFIVHAALGPSLFGRPTFAALIREGVLVERGVAEVYPCPAAFSSGCPRRVDYVGSPVETPYLATCGNAPAFCEALRLTAAEVAEYAFSEAGFHDLLRRLFGVDERTPNSDLGAPVRLGIRGTGVSAVDILLLRDWDDARLVRASLAMSSHRAQLLVVSGDRAPPDVRAEASREGDAIVLLHDVLFVEEGRVALRWVDSLVHCVSSRDGDFVVTRDALEARVRESRPEVVVRLDVNPPRVDVCGPLGVAPLRSELLTRVFIELATQSEPVAAERLRSLSDARRARPGRILERLRAALPDGWVRLVAKGTYAMSIPADRELIIVAPDPATAASLARLPWRPPPPIALRTAFARFQEGELDRFEYQRLKLHEVLHAIAPFPLSVRIQTYALLAALLESDPTLVDLVLRATQSGR